MTINDGWDVAHLLMHSSLDELGSAHSLHEDISKIDIDATEETECFMLSPKVESIDNSIKKHLVKSVVLFQAGMEAVIHWAQSIDSSIPQSRSFSKKWENAFIAKGSHYDFSPYKSFYENYRIHIVHPDRDERFKTINDLSFTDVYEGIQNGWLAYAALSDVIGFKHDEDSWHVMCRAHQLPTSITVLNYPCPHEVIRSLNLKYRSYLNRLNT